MISATGSYSSKASRSSEPFKRSSGKSSSKPFRYGESNDDIWKRQSTLSDIEEDVCAVVYSNKQANQIELTRCQSQSAQHPEEIQLLTYKQKQPSIETRGNYDEHKIIRSSGNSSQNSDKRNSNFKRRGTLHNLRRKFSTFRLPNSAPTNGRLFNEIDPLNHDCKTSGCERIKLNVSGQYYETFVGMLNRHPDTLLGNPIKRQQLYDQARNEFFIDRHRPSFEAVFEYYQHGGKLKRPHNVPDDIFLTELMYYELEQDVVEEYKNAEGYTKEELVLPENETLRKIWILFEFPETSWAALVIAVLSVIMTIASIVLFCIETLPVFALSHCVSDEAPNFLDPFFIIETTCTMWFTFELLIRFIACPNKLLFWKDFKNIVDLTAVIPYYVTFINVVSTMSCASAKSSASLAFLRVIRLVRVFKLTKHSVGLQILILTFKASIEGLGLFLIALVVCLLVFSSAIYFAEQGVEGTQIDSIPDAFWWAIITMTTVGYGDKVPVGVLGKIIGSICALVGVLTLAIPVPIITGNFNRFYAHKTGRLRPGG